MATLQAKSPYCACLGRSINTATPVCAGATVSRATSNKPVTCARKSGKAEMFMPYCPFKMSRIAAYRPLSSNGPPRRKKLRILACGDASAAPYSSSGSMSSAHRTLRSPKVSRHSRQERKKFCKAVRDRACTVSWARSKPAKRTILAGTGS